MWNSTHAALWSNHDDERDKILRHVGLDTVEPLSLYILRHNDLTTLKHIML